MSNYVYANGRGPSLGALNVNPSVAASVAASMPRLAPAQIRAFLRIKPLSPEDLDAGQKKAVLARNRQKVIEELRKQGLAGKVEILADGSLRLVNPVGAIDDLFASLLRQGVPTFGVDVFTGKFTRGQTMSPASLINMLPVSAEIKAEFTRAPFSAVLRIFDPIWDFVGDVCTEAMNRGLDARAIAAKTHKEFSDPLKGGYVYDLSGFPFFMGAKGRAVNIALEQPGDELFEEVSRRQIKRMRTLFAWCVLFFKKFLLLHAILAREMVELIFPEEDVQLYSLEAEAENTPETAYVVDELPNKRAVDANGTRYSQFDIGYDLKKDSRGGEYWEYNEMRGPRGRKAFYRLSPRGQYDRLQALQADWDEKYIAYRNDYCTWDILGAAARVAWLRTVEGKTEEAARRQTAREYGLKTKFSDSPILSLGPRFRVGLGVPKRLGGPSGGHDNRIGSKNGPRPEVRGARPPALPRAPENQSLAERRLAGLVAYYMGAPYRLPQNKAEELARSQLGGSALTLPVRAPASLTSAGVPPLSLNLTPKIAGYGGYVFAPGLGNPAAAAAAPVAGVGSVAAADAATLAFAEAIVNMVIAVGTLILKIIAAVKALLVVIFGGLTALEATKQGKDVEFSADGVKTPTPGSLPPVDPSQPPPGIIPDPPDPEEDRIGTQGGGSGDSDTPSSGGFPVLPVALAAGVALLLVARR